MSTTTGGMPVDAATVIPEPSPSEGKACARAAGVPAPVITPLATSRATALSAVSAGRRKCWNSEGTAKRRIPV